MTDVRPGDLVKFTHRYEPDVTFTSRVHKWSGGSFYVSGILGRIHVRDFDFEVLDRPAPPLDKGLVQAAADKAGREVYRFDGAGSTFTEAVTTAITHYITELYKKENAK